MRFGSKVQLSLPERDREKKLSYATIVTLVVENIVLLERRIKSEPF